LRRPRGVSGSGAESPVCVELCRTGRADRASAFASNRPKAARPLSANPAVRLRLAQRPTWVDFRPSVITKGRFSSSYLVALGSEAIRRERPGAGRAPAPRRRAFRTAKTSAQASSRIRADASSSRQEKPQTQCCRHLSELYADLIGLSPDHAARSSRLSRNE
jgi:hypothetical protein